MKKKIIGGVNARHQEVKEGSAEKVTSSYFLTMVCFAYYILIISAKLPHECNYC